MIVAPVEILVTIADATKIALLSSRVLSISLKAQQIKGISNQKENQNDEKLPYYQYQIFYNNKRIDQQKEEEFLDEIKLENIVKIERHCCSSWGSIPSGIGTVFSMVLKNKAVRDEFIILQTPKYLILTEISKSLDCKCEGIRTDLYDNRCRNCQQKGNQVQEEKIQILVWDCKDDNQKQQILNKQFKNRKWHRILREFDQSQIIPNLKIINYIMLWDTIQSLYSTMKVQAEQKNQVSKSFHNFFSNCGNQFARTQLYFSSKKESHLIDTVDSIFGSYSDKPMYILDPLQLGIGFLTEKIAVEVNENYKQAILKMKQHVLIMQTCNISLSASNLSQTQNEEIYEELNFAESMQQHFNKNLTEIDSQCPIDKL